MRSRHHGQRLLLIPRLHDGAARRRDPIQDRRTALRRWRLIWLRPPGRRVGILLPRTSSRRPISNSTRCTDPARPSGRAARSEVEEESGARGVMRRRRSSSFDPGSPTMRKSAESAPAAKAGAIPADPPKEPIGSLSRRSFLTTGLAVGAAASLGPLGHAAAALADSPSSALTTGDAAILRFLAAAELIEADLWQQYNELGGIQDSEEPGGTGSRRYTAALSTRSATPSSSTPTSPRGARNPSTWIRSARCPAARRPGLGRSDG